MKNKEHLCVALGVVCIALVMFFPLPMIFIDIVLVFTIIVSVMTLIISIRQPALSSLPTILLFETVLSLVIYISSARFILTRGIQIKDYLIKPAYGMLRNILDGNGLTVLGIIYFIFAITLVCTSSKLCKLTKNKYNALIEKNIDKSEETEKGNNEISKEKIAYFGALDGVAIFIKGNTKVFMLIYLATIIIGMVIKKGSIFDVVNIFLPLALINGLFNSIPVILHQIIIKVKIQNV